MTIARTGGNETQSGGGENPRRGLVGRLAGRWTTRAAGDGFRTQSKREAVGGLVGLTVVTALGVPGVRTVVDAIVTKTMAGIGGGENLPQALGGELHSGPVTQEMPPAAIGTRSEPRH